MEASAYQGVARRKRTNLRCRRPRLPGGAADVGERSCVGARAKPPPFLPRAPGGLWGRGRGLRQVRAGVHVPGRPPEEGPLRAGVRGPAELLRRRGQEDPEGRPLGKTKGAKPGTWY